MPPEIETGGRVVESFLQTLVAQGYVPRTSNRRPSHGQPLALEGELRVDGDGCGTAAQQQEAASPEGAAAGPPARQTRLPARFQVCAGLPRRTFRRRLSRPAIAR